MYALYVHSRGRYAAQSHDIVNNTMGFPAEGSHCTGGTHYQHYRQIVDDIAGSAHRVYPPTVMANVGDMGTLY